MFYLYLKTHSKTGLKYLGQTRKDPYKYPGSGKVWLAHLRENGKHITTEILKESESKDEINKIGEHYSILWNIVDSQEFANIIVERGSGGVPGQIPWSKGRKLSDEHRKKISLSNKGVSRSRGAEATARAAISNTGKKRSEETKQKIRIAAFKRYAK